MTTELLDLASFQHPNNAAIDWHAVAGAGIAGVIIKITEGTSYVNPWIDRTKNPLGADDIADAQAAGLFVCGYHFLHPSIGGVAQAQYYLANGGNRIKGAWIDAEVTDNQSWQAIETDMQNCHDYLAVNAGKTTGCYLNKTWYAATGIGNWGWYIWLADPSDPAPAYPCVNWQYGMSPVPGIQGQVDRDRWVGDMQTFGAFFGTPAPTPAPTPTPTPTPPPKEVQMASPLHVADNANNEAVEFCYFDQNGHLVQAVWNGTKWLIWDMTNNGAVLSSFPAACTT